MTMTAAPLPRPCTVPPQGPAAARAAALSALVPVLEGDRVRLRAPTLHDFPAYDRIMAADTGHMGGPFTPDRIWADFCNYIAGWMLRGLGTWTVETRAGDIVGFVNLALEWGDEEPELGWMILPDHRGQGLGTEAARLARDWGMDQVATMVSYADPANTRSIALAERLGAVRDRAAEAAIATSDDDPVTVWRHKPVAEGAR